MVSTLETSIWDRVRDYWRLEITRIPAQDDGLLVSLRGRRRTAEPYGVPVVMDRAALERIVWAFQSATAVIAGVWATGVRDCQSSSTTKLVLARCSGAFYEIEIICSVVAGYIESVELMVTVPAVGARPVVHLIDEDINVFAADLADAREEMNRH